jgi:ABC-type nitrate/sulfonate/bicarbonate transport system substrate-binding protein
MGKYLQEQPRFMFFNKHWVAKNPEATRRFLVAMHRAMQWVRQNPPIESAKVAAEYLKQPAETLARSIKWYTWDPRITESTLKLVEADQGFLQELKRITRPVNPRDGFDLSFQARLLADRPQLYSDLR